MVSNNLKRDDLVIQHIYDHCLQILNNISKDDCYETFIDNQNQKDIICFNELQIGELAKLLSDEFKKLHKEIPWKKVTGMRDNIVHGYTKIDFSIIWQTAIEDILPLFKMCKSVLKIA